MTRLLFLAIHLLLSIALFGCAAPTTKIAYSKAETYATEPKRVFVISEVGSEFGKDFGASFEKRFADIAKDCGAATEVSRRVSLELDSNIHTNKMKAFRPDTLLTIYRNGGTKDPYGGLILVIYDVQLKDVQSNKTVWRAEVNFSRGAGPLTGQNIAERGQTLAVDVTNKMKESGIFRSCAVINPKR